MYAVKFEARSSASGAVFAALELDGWHLYLMFGVTAAVVIIAGIYLAGRIPDPLTPQAAEAKPDAAKSRGD
jgi:hypothetical protein